MTFTPGVHLGPYRIVQLIGSGGMGVVYRAHDARLGRDVALKVVSDALGTGDEATARFEREARAVAALSHPNIVAIHDVGQVDGRPFAVTELLDGESLRARLARGPLPWSDAIELALAAASGLGAAHARGIVHRDIKPENLFVTADRRLKILDFGLAQAQPSALASESPTQALTGAGLVVGTVGYLSPEQARGGPTGPPSDVFSLGAVIYEMVTGRRAFEGATTVDRLAAVLHVQPEPLGSLVRDLPPQVAAIVQRCLDKDPARRFGDAEELASALHDVLSESGRRRAVAGTRAAPARRARSLAVLPFEISPPNPDAEFLGDGLAESIINSLTAVPRLRVVPRSTMFRYKGRGLDAGAVGRDVDATSVLAGRLSWRGDVLQLQIELVDPVNDAQVWGHQYTRRADDIFALQEALARDVTEALKLRLAAPARRRSPHRPPVSADAYQDYLRGRFHAAQYSPDGFARAITSFEAAVAKDPDYAQAHAELGDAIATARFFGYVLPDESRARASEVTARALVLDPNVAEAHASRGKQAFFFDRDFAAAGASFDRALAIAPAYAECRVFAGLLDMVCGRREQGLAAGRRALEDAPRAPLVNAGMSVLLLFARDFEGAIAQGQRTVAMDPGFFLGRQTLLFALERLGRFEEALVHLEPLLAAYACPPDSVERVRRAWHEGGARGYWEARLAMVQEQLARRYTPPQFLLYLYANLGDVNRALEWAERLYQIDAGILVFLGIDPCIDTLRADPRFQALLRRCGLPAVDDAPASRATGPAAG